MSVPDAKFTKGEFQVVMKVVQLLPDGHLVKKEVDAALDTVSETMTPMHYHLREVIISTYRQASAGPAPLAPQGGLRFTLVEWGWGGRWCGFRRAAGPVDPSEVLETRCGRGRVKRRNIRDPCGVGYNASV